MKIKYRVDSFWFPGGLNIARYLYFDISFFQKENNSAMATPSVTQDGKTGEGEEVLKQKSAALLK